MRLNRREFLGATALVGLHGLLARRVGATRQGGAKAKETPFPELRLAGSPAEIGLGHGRALAEQIRANVAFYLKWLASETEIRDPAALLRVASSFGPVLARQQPELLEEIDGIARGSGLGRNELLLLNARTDMLVMGRDVRPAAPRPGCTSVALSSRMRGDALIALGQTWDWNPELAGGTVVLRLRPANGPRIVTFTEAGMVGKIGFNEHRLGICLNFLSHPSEDPARDFGMPVHCLIRAVLGCSSLEEAGKLVSWAPRCASANFLLAQHGPQGPIAVNLEWTPTAVARIPLRSGVLVHANHFKDPALAPCGETRASASSSSRDKAATAAAMGLRQKVPDPVERMKRVLASRSSEPHSVSQEAAPGAQMATLAGIVMDLSRNALWLAAGPPHQRPWVRRPGV